MKHTGCVWWGECVVGAVLFELGCWVCVGVRLCVRRAEGV